MNHYVYIITNLMNGKKYIGKRSCRCKIEDDKYMGSGKILAKAKEKYGIEWFEKKILMVCETEDEAFEEERKAIELVDGINNEMYYNVTCGGRGCGSGKNHPMYGRSSAMLGKKGISHPKSRKVACLNTGEVFDSVHMAMDYANLKNASPIVSVCRSKYLSAGTDSNNNKLVWRYLEDYEKMTKNEIDIAVRNAQDFTRAKSVVCLNTGEIFKSAVLAGEKYEINNTSIQECCLGKIKSYGFDDIKKQKLVWMYLEDYKLLSEYDIKKRLNNGIYDNMGRHQVVVCLNTREVFNSIKEAREFYNIKHKGSIGMCCKQQYKRSHAGRHPITGEPLRWMYLEDYEDKYGKFDKEVS